jgi:hypothetical protein
MMADAARSEISALYEIIEVAKVRESPMWNSILPMLYKEPYSWLNDHLSYEDDTSPVSKFSTHKLKRTALQQLQSNYSYILDK